MALLSANEISKTLGCDPRRITRRVKKGSLIADSEGIRGEPLFDAIRLDEIREAVGDTSNSRGPKAKPKARKKAKPKSLPTDDERTLSIDEKGELARKAPLTKAERAVIQRAFREGTLGAGSPHLNGVQEYAAL